MPVRPTVARLDTARRRAMADLERIHNYAWTQEDQDHFDSMVKPVVMAQLWSHTEHISTYIFAQFAPLE